MALTPDRKEPLLVSTLIICLIIHILNTTSYNSVSSFLRWLPNHKHTEVDFKHLRNNLMHSE